MRIAIIVAMASNGVIGDGLQLPWHLPADLRRFRQLTWGSPLIMGRMTHQSIGRPLPGRTNLVISRNPAYAAPGCLVCADPRQALRRACALADQVFVIGGAGVYRFFMPMAEVMHMTAIDKAFGGDTCFPPWRPEEWLEQDRHDVDDDAVAGFAYSFVTYVRNRPQKLTDDG